MDERDDKQDDSLDAQESLFIVEGLSEASNEGEEPEAPQIIDMMTPPPVEDETPSSLELAPLTVNLGEAPAATPIDEAFDEMLSPEAAATQDAQAAEETGEATEENEDSAAGEEEAGIPPLYKWGSIAAAFLLLVTGGALVWKKQQAPAAEIAVAKGPKRVITPPAPDPVPAPEIAPGKEELALDKAPGVGESETVAVAPAQSEETSVEVSPAPPAVIEPEVVETAPVAAVEAPATTREPVTAVADPVATEIEPRIRRGEGILQLKNGNLFPGRVMKVTSKNVVLRVAEGDFVFPLDDVVQVLPSGSKDYEGFPHGFVELANGNRIWGRILDKGEETVTVASGIAKIVLKRGEVVSVKLGLGLGIVP